MTASLDSIQVASEISDCDNLPKMEEEFQKVSGELFEFRKQKKGAETSRIVGNSQLGDLDSPNLSNRNSLPGEEVRFLLDKMVQDTRC